MALQLERLAREAVQGWEKGEDVAGPMQRLKALVGMIEAERAEHAPLIERARDLHATDELEIDDEPMLSLCEPEAGGNWVSAWVWVSNPEAQGS